MFKNTIGLRGSLEREVNISDFQGANVGKGTLKISPNKSPVVDLGMNSYYHSANHGNLIVNTSDSIYLTLIGCRHEGCYIYPDLVAQGKDCKGEFSKFSFVLQGFFEWMDDSYFSDIKLMKETSSNTISKSLNQRKFDVKLNIPDKGMLRIYSENVASARREGNKHTITQNILIKCECLDFLLAANEMIKNIYEIRNFLSLLLGHPLCIEYAFNEYEKTRKEVYFANNQDDKAPFKNYFDCFIPAGVLEKTDRWQQVFNTSLCVKKDRFVDLWSRLANIVGFSRFWEYELLACISLVDRYSLILCKENDESISRTEFKKLTKHLKSSVEEFDTQDPHFEEIKKCVKSQVSSLRNSKFSSFNDRFDYAVDNTTSDFWDVLDFTDDDFNHVKKIRNKVAHGDVPQTKNDVDITYEHTLQGKLLLLLYYWMYRDLGFEEKEIIFYIRNSMHSIIRSSSLNQKSLDRTLGQYPFVDISKNDFDNIESDFRVVLECSDDGYIYRKDLSELIKQWPSKESDKKDLAEFLADNVPSADVNSVTYVNYAYVQFEEQSRKVSDVCILNSDLKIDGYHRELQFNSEINKWEPFTPDRAHSQKVGESELKICSGETI